jgi:hypothetical protein
MISENPRADRIAVSFVIDTDPVFAYSAWHLAHSLVDRIGLPWSAIHVQHTPEVRRETVAEFAKLGCSTHGLDRFGDGKFCNKLAQWETLRQADADHFLFLDTDMICVSDIIPFLSASAISAKTVDIENPSQELLDVLFERHGFRDRPRTVHVEAQEGTTFQGNCNGGAYSVPAEFCEPLFAYWRRHAFALLEDIELLKAVGKADHIDQIAFCMALHESGFPFEVLPSNANYYLHLPGAHALRDPERPIALLHYHNSSLNLLGLLEPRGAVLEEEHRAVKAANRQISRRFRSPFFWDFRYSHFPERGSGVGSRGAILQYKRDLLRSAGAEQATSVLDIGCGDLEVVRDLRLHDYVGVDSSTAALACAAGKKPDWVFVEAPALDVCPAEMVLCFEVLIHQESERDYRQLVGFLAEKTLKTLIVSGYDRAPDDLASNHMLFFYEPLSETIAKLGCFRTVRQIGMHSTDVVILRCDR